MCVWVFVFDGVMGRFGDSSLKVACQNSSCAFYLKGEGRHVVKKGFNRAGHQIFQCKHCGKHFNETTNTPLFHKKLSEDDFILIGKMLNEGVGIRGCERVTGHHRDTIMRVARSLAKHAAFIANALGEGLDPGCEHEVDEAWTFIQKKKSTKG